jgi:hypothetical protein
LLKKVAELELEGNNRRGKVLYITEKHWLHLLHIGAQDIVRNHHEWQINNLQGV